MHDSECVHSTKGHVSHQLCQVRMSQNLNAPPRMATGEFLTVYEASNAK